MVRIETVDLTAEFKCGELYDPGLLGSFEGHFVAKIYTVRSALSPLNGDRPFSNKEDATIQIAYLAGVIQTLRPMVEIIQLIQRDFGGSPLQGKADWEFISGISAIFQGFLGVGAAITSVIGVFGDLDRADLKAIIIFDGFAASAITGLSVWRWWVGSADSRHDRVQEIMQRLESYLVFFQSVSTLHTILSTLEQRKVSVKKRKAWRRSRERELKTALTCITTTVVKRRRPSIRSSPSYGGSSSDGKSRLTETVALF